MYQYRGSALTSARVLSIFSRKESLGLVVSWTKLEPTILESCLLTYGWSRYM